VQAVVELGSWPVLPIFNYLRRLGKIEIDEMLRTFNLGIGMVLVVPPRHLRKLEAELERRRERFYRIGRIEPLSSRPAGRAPFDFARHRTVQGFAQGRHGKPRVVYTGRLPA
jgi:phosphoribosylaminoimidazole (AIR) synthetase